VIRLVGVTLDVKRYPILVVDDEQDNLDAFRFNFRKTFDIQTASSGAEALGILGDKEVAVVVTDQRMPKMTGIELLREVRARQPDAVGIILTAFTDVDVLVEAINLGQVYRYITKPWDAKEVRGVLQYAIERYHLTRENKRLAAQLAEYTGYLNQQLHGEFDFGNIIGESAALREVLAKVEQVAPTASTVLLRGETGTGKELVAHAIHINSPREEKPFVRVNCAALAPGILESELFGHEKGSFTGATEKQVGKFEQADRGTIFLDEVGDMSQKTQAKVLRVLQEQEVERLGSARTIKVDVRVIAATNKNLEEAIERGEFREDLYFRLNVIPIVVPPLRDRREDIPRLVQHFAKRTAEEHNLKPKRFEPSAMDVLSRYRWRGNIRELRNTVERLMIMTPVDAVRVEDLPSDIRNAEASVARTSAPVPAPAAENTPANSVPKTDRHPAGAGTLREFKDAAERAYLVQKLRENNWNISKTAEIIDTPRSNLYKKLEQYGIKQEVDG